MKMFQILPAALAATVISPAFAHEEPVTFSRDGVSYTYTVETVGTRRIIEGRATPGAPFRLVVSGNRVTGEANGVPVSFRVKSKATEPATDLADASR